MADISRLQSIPLSQRESRSPPRPHSSGVDSATADTKSRRASLPFVFPPLLPKNTSSTFLIPSTAEGRPVPLDGSTAAHRTTALRQLNRSQPSPRHRYTRSSEPPSIKSTITETYSQPVVVRTYSGLPPTSTTKGPVSVSTAPPPSSPTAHSPARSVTAINTMRFRGKDKPRSRADAKLPPLEAFSFKSIMADIQHDVGADLDRIAEICARSRYSLSNQYEVHIAPQGSGSGFVEPSTTSSSSRPSLPMGPTLQAISSDDEHVGPMQKKRRGMARRKSVAYGTLETIMSSSRSSDEDKCKKKPAAEIVQEVRGRTTEHDSIENQTSSEQYQWRQLSPKPALFAKTIIERPRKHVRSGRDGASLVTSGESSGAGKVFLGGLAKTQVSRNHLQTRTLPEKSYIRYYIHRSPLPSRAVARESVTAATIMTPGEPRSTSTFATWMPWKGASVDTNRLGGYTSYAEGTLRELLKSTIPFTSRDKGNNHLDI
ncbi:hypothetical protein F4821DRAFT_228342 [Hypoxylon rubiginosum]|uniref:Uncharacterized protein n=1 Tax=Hypoxylon rubiginosum TaxID=110542 RepID=A0ACC0DEE5_9PEZI|nr:hypothetical protein F4821DRAFT_228342 [Hypoxylon rubiginosum]